MSVDVSSIPCCIAMPVVGPRRPFIRLAEVISALTYALDLTEGQRPGHTLRTALIAMRLGRELDLDDDTLGALYYAALLKDSGCSSNAARMSALFGSDDHDVKRDMRLVDWHVDEHWCGLGHPVGVAGDEIPLLSRILLLAQTLEVYWSENGIDAAIDMTRQRRGRWFDPRLVDLVGAWRRDRAWWATLADSASLDHSVLALEPGSVPMHATHERLDSIAYAFAAVIDAKTPFTARHSTNVARYAVSIALSMGADADMCRETLRAGLLHDIGKLGVSNRILDKPGTLTDEEFGEIRKHPRWTWEILERVRAFHGFAQEAAQHHERLDGHGYPWKLVSSQLGQLSRVLAVADVFEALTADRPYRAGLTVPAVLDIMRRERGKAFDRQVFDAAAVLAESGTFAVLAAGRDDPFPQLLPEPAKFLRFDSVG